MIRVERVFRSFEDGARGPVKVLDGVEVHVAEGEFVAVVGRSGSGKSTLLNVIGGLDSDFTGQVTVAGTALAGLSDARLSRFRNETVGFVFQAFHLVPRWSAVENVMLPAKFGARRVGGASDREVALRALERVGLAGKGERLPSALSGGERQRVAIARALFGRPRVLLCDEPTGNLDAQTAEEIIGLFSELNREGLTIVAVTHEERLRCSASRTVELVGGKVGPLTPALSPLAGRG